MQIAPSLRRRLLPIWVVAGVALLVLFAHNAAGVGGGAPDRLFSDWIHVGLIVFAALACAVRCALLRAERTAWALFGVALGLWSAGELYQSLFLAKLEVTPFPSLGDFFYVGFYPVAFAALVSVVRSRVRALGGALLLDGLVAALAACSVAAAFLFESVLLTLAGEADAKTIIFNLAYPIGDLVLLGAVAGALSLTGWRPGRTLAALGAGMFIVALADGLYLVQSVKGNYVEGAWLDTLWPAGLLLIGWASFQPAKPVTLRLGGWRILALPIVLSMAAVAVLVAGQLGAVNAVALALATAAVVAVIIRMVWTLRDNTVLLESTRTEAMTDALTGLANRRSLSMDLERTLAMAGPETPWVLVLFDLDGFKDYNDTFGHPAGDALLSRLGRDLRAAVKGNGSAYRPGGDEFTVLVDASEAGAEAVIAACVAALSEKGDNYRIRPSWGAAVLPTEADTVSEALHIADQRMYARKGGRRSSAKQQSIDVLISVLHERQVELHQHSTGVAELAVRAGERLSMNLEDLEEMAFAAELHDIGKLAVSEQLLNKPAALTEAEWAEMHKHTVIGERILRAAPALQPVARIVRASHERWDGAGYPDRVAGQQIPLGARVVAVCDAYDAMTSDRPYRLSIGQEQAMEELQRCAGTQFDPQVVDAVCAVLADPGVAALDEVPPAEAERPEPAVA
jgi:two-component system cell cycle response regulator